MTEIPKSELDLLKNRVSVAELVRSRGIELKSVGQDLKGLCPFHSEKTPSFSVTPSKELYHCFGCDRGGDVFSFVMESDGVDFPEAVRRIQLFAEGNSNATDKLEELRLYVNDRILLEQVTSHYQRRFLETPRAIEYLKKRGIVNPDTINAFNPLFFDESLSKIMPRGHAKSGKELIDQLVKLGIRNEKNGREIMMGYVAFPSYGEDGSIQQLVARYIGVAGHRPRYLLLSRPHAGIFNRVALLHQKQIILTEGIMDCLTFYEHGFRNVTCGFGSNGFHDDLFTAITQSGIQTVYIAYDNDEAGNIGTDKVVEKLSQCGIGVYRISFPKGMDANEYVQKTSPGKHALTVLINSAEWIGKGNPTSPMLSGSIKNTTSQIGHGDENRKNKENQSENKSQKITQGGESGETNSAPSIESIRSKQETSVKILEGDICELSFGDRLYRVFGLFKNHTMEVMKVNIRVYIDEAYFSETLDLSSNKLKDRYAKDAAEALRGKTEIFKRDLERMFLKLEDVQQEHIYGEKEKKNKPVEISDEDKKEAFKFLKSKRMFKEIEEHFKACGVVGEETNLQVMYLAATSRLLAKPIHILIQSSSAAGKSTLMKAILNLMPPEDVHLYSALTGQALYYMQDKDLKHKILAIEEDKGAEKAEYIIKMLQTEGRVNIATTIKDPGTGHMAAFDYWVEGPTSCWKTTTAVWIDDEILNRFLVIATDESREQTKRILEAQREMRTLEGWQSREDRKTIFNLHHNAQRLLRTLPVINPYARHLSFQDDKHRLRRDHEKYQSLIESVALLRQYQKPILKRIKNDKEEDYINVDLKDIRIANRLANFVLGRTLDDLPPHTRTFLSNIASLADAEAKRLKILRSQVRLSRRQMVEFVGLSFTQTLHHIHKLIEMEYVIPGRSGSLFSYEVLYRGEGQDGKPFLPGVIDLKELEKKLDKKNKPDEEDDNPDLGKVAGGGL